MIVRTWKKNIFLTSLIKAIKTILMVIFFFFLLLSNFQNEYKNQMKDHYLSHLRKKFVMLFIKKVRTFGNTWQQRLRTDLKCSLVFVSIGIKNKTKKKLKDTFVRSLKIIVHLNLILEKSQNYISKGSSVSNIFFNLYI